MHFFNSHLTKSKEISTQTSKTVLQLAVEELGNLYSKNNLKKLKKNDKKVSQRTPKSYQEIYVNRKEFIRSTSPMSQISSQRQTVNAQQENARPETISISSLSSFLIKRIRIKPVSSTESNKINLNISSQGSPHTVSRDISPQHNEPQYPGDAEHNITKFPKMPGQPGMLDKEQITFKEEINTLLTQMKCSDWNVALAALKKIANLSEKLDQESMYPYMPEINQRLIQLIQSPRSHVCRTSCQIAGQLFHTVGDTRRPEFDDIVDLLLGIIIFYFLFLKKSTIDTVTDNVVIENSVNNNSLIDNSNTRQLNNAIIN